MYILSGQYVENQEWTICRHWQHWGHKIQDEYDQIKNKVKTTQSTTQTTKKMSNTNPTKNRG